MSNSKVVKKRVNSTKEYIDRLIENNSRINVIRMDLSYKKKEAENLTFEDGDKDLDHMFNNMRSKKSIFKDKIGHIIKKEYTKDKGIHMHTMFIFNGNKVKKDAFKADQIGKYWKDNITNGKGAYHNCNKNKYKKNGVGMIAYKDKEKIEILYNNVIPYLCKDDPKQSIESVKSSSKSKAFLRGTMPKKKGNIGRPRKDEEVKD